MLTFFVSLVTKIIIYALINHSHDIIVVTEFYPVCKHNPSSRCPWFGTFDANVSKIYVTVVICNCSCYLKKCVHIAVSVTECSRGVWAEARFVRIYGDSITLMER